MRGRSFKLRARRLMRHNKRQPMRILNRQNLGPWISAFVGISMAVFLICSCERAIVPTTISLVETDIKNTVSLIVNNVISQTLSTQDISYNDIVTLQKDDTGHVTALTTNSSIINAIQTEILSDVTEQVKTLRTHDLGVPVGTLTGFAPFSERGPRIPVRVLSVASSSADYTNQYKSAGINQVLHQVVLNVQVSINLIIAGKTIEVPTTTQVSICETIIVGNVPDTYLQIGIP